MRRLRFEAGADHQGPAGRGASLGRRRFEGGLDHREAGRSPGRQPELRSRRHPASRHDPRHRHQRRIEAAGSGSDDQVAAAERVAPDLKRPQLDGSVAPALRNHRLAGPQQPRGNDVRPVGHQQHPRRVRSGIEHSPDQPLGGADRHSHRYAIASPGGQDREAARALEGGADEPAGGDGRCRLRSRSWSAALSSRFSSRMARAWSNCCAMASRWRFNAPFWLAAVPIVAGAAARPETVARDLGEAAADRCDQVDADAAQVAERLGRGDRDSKQRSGRRPARSAPR